MNSKTVSANRLAFEKSPYLLQHAQNPVDWFPWGEEAFSVARTTNRPVFLSVGYSTCHWCHVMAHESFENPEIARLLNEVFVNVKVDREERPDVDRVYMAFVQATTGAGGWPMSVWLTPKGEPIFGGTYFPPDDRYGRPGFPRVIRAIVDLWKREPKHVTEQGRSILTALSEAPPRKSSNETIPTIVSLALDQFGSVFDSENGGFGPAPKFPRASTFEFLLRNPETGRQMALLSLRKIALGGIFDHLGGGFHRYSVDEFWQVPHFEKMLYDQAQLAFLFTEAFQISKDPLFAQTALHTLEYVRRDLSDVHGGFYSAEDADSEVPGGGGSRAEGAFYLWESSEILDVLGPELGELFYQVYGVLEGGNASKSGDPHGEFKGLNILSRRLAPQDFAQQRGQSLETIEKSLAAARQQLFNRRENRPRPHRDDKVLTAWNGLAISAFARAGTVFQQQDLVRRAAHAADFLQTQMWKEGRLLRSWRQGSSSIPGFAADYAFLIQGLLDLYEASFSPGWLIWALELQTVLDREFWDDAEGSYFESVAREVYLPLSIRDRYDGAEPAANSVAAFNLFRLARMFRNVKFEQRGERILSGFLDKKNPTNLPFLLAAALFREGPSEEIVIAGAPESPQTRTLQYAVRRQFRPNSILLLADGGKGSELLSGMNAAISEMKPINGQPAAYICKEFTCQGPTVDPERV